MSRHLVSIVFIFFLGLISAAQETEIRTVPVGRGNGNVETVSTSVVRGRVFYAETSRPVRRASIMLVRETGGPGEMSALTDAGGNFEIRTVPPGTYYPMVNAPGVVTPLAFLDLSKGDRPGRDESMADAFKDFEKIVVNGVNDVDVQIAARRGGAISGRVMYDDGDVAIGVKVEILRKVDGKFLGVIPNISAILGMFGGSGSFQTDDRGMFRFSGLPPGEYIVKATESATHSTSQKRGNMFESLLLGGGSSFLTVYSPDVFDPGAAQIVAVEYGIELTEINVTIPGRYLYRVGGTVISRKDKTPVRADIMIERVEATKTFSLFSEIGKMAQGSPTDDGGSWMFKELPKGTYRLIVAPSTPIPGLSDDIVDANGEKETRPPLRPKQPEAPKFAKTVKEITIEDKDVSDVRIELGFGARISGTVAVENLFSEMPTGVTIRANGDSEDLMVAGNVWNYENRSPDKPAKLNREFVIDAVPEGKTRFDVLVNEDGYYVKSMMFGSTDLLAGEIEVKEGERLDNVRIVLGKGMGTIKGSVGGEDKEPVAGALILAVPTDPKRRSATFKRNGRTDDAGGFELKVAPGEYAVVLVPQEMASMKGEAFERWLESELRSFPTVKLEGGKTESVKLTLKK